jgi:hypothetical protein
MQGIMHMRRNVIDRGSIGSIGSIEPPIGSIGYGLIDRTPPITDQSPIGGSIDMPTGVTPVPKAAKQAAKQPGRPPRT